MRYDPYFRRHQGYGKDCGEVYVSSQSLRVGYDMQSPDFQMCDETREERLTDSMCGQWKRPLPRCE